MVKRADRSILLTLSEQETKTLRDIIKPKVEGSERMSLPKRVLGVLSAVFLFALVVLGVVKPEMAIAIAKVVGLLVELWF